MPALTRFIPLAFLGGTILPMLSPAPAAAINITVGGINYDVSAFSTSPASQPAAFGLPPLGQMPWWGNDTLAYDFATTLFNQLGAGWDANYGPVFAYSLDTSLNELRGLAQSITDINDLIDVTASTVSTNTYAIASLLPDVPGPLPVLATATGWGWSRRLRQRLRQAGTVAPFA